jgi:hypothetical protein
VEREDFWKKTSLCEASYITILDNDLKSYGTYGEIKDPDVHVSRDLQDILQLIARAEILAQQDTSRKASVQPPSNPENREKNNAC